MADGVAGVGQRGVQNLGQADDGAGGAMAEQGGQRQARCAELSDFFRRQRDGASVIENLRFPCVGDGNRG